MENCDFFVDCVLRVVVAFMLAKLSFDISLATMLGDDEIFLMLHIECLAVVAFEFGNFVVADELAVVLDA